MHANTHPNPHIQCLLYVHTPTHSCLRILCKLCTCIPPLKPAHTLQTVYMHPPTQASHTLQAVYIQTAHANLHASLHASSACKICRQRYACACRDCMQSAACIVESACRTGTFACIIFMQTLQICRRILCMRRIMRCCIALLFGFC